MSRSLNRIRSLISEIEMIQKQGQRMPVDEAPSVTPAIEEFALKGEAIPISSLPETGRVRVEWSGSVVIDLHFPHSQETLELRQVGEQIEIRFSDGKAFHIPFKSVA